MTPKLQSIKEKINQTSATLKSTALCKRKDKLQRKYFKNHMQGWGKIGLQFKWKIQ